MPDDRGSAVAEFAIALPAVLLVLTVLLGGLQVAGAQVRAQDAAADAARAFARGDSHGAVEGRLARQLPRATLEQWRADDLVCVRISSTPAGPGGLLGVRASAQSCAVAGGR